LICAVIFYLVARKSDVVQECRVCRAESRRLYAALAHRGATDRSDGAVARERGRDDAAEDTTPVVFPLQMG
jgi:hypothetical protein